MQTVTYRGSIAELQGTSWEIPDSVPHSNMAAWIESQHREAELQAAADAEREQREQEVLAARLEKAKQDASIDRLNSEIQSLATGLEDLEQRIVAEPDVSAQLQFNSAAADIYARNLQLADEVKTMQAVVSDLLERTTAMAEATKEGERLQQQSLALLKNNQEQINGSFESYSRAIADLQGETNEASLAVGRLNTEAQDNRELIRTAREITETAINVAGQQAKKATDEAMDEILSILSLALEAMGINEQSLALQLNTDEIDPNRGVFLTREYLRRIKDIHAAKGNARDSNIDGPLL